MMKHEYKYLTIARETAEKYKYLSFATETVRSTLGEAPSHTAI